MAPSRLPHLILTAALCSMVCDGEVHPDEMNELRAMINVLPIFNGQELDNQLEMEIQQALADPFKLFDRFFGDLKESQLDTAEGLQVIEIVLRVIQADGKVEQSEIQFVTTVIQTMRLPIEIIQARFGDINFLRERIDMPKEHSQDPLSVPLLRKQFIAWGTAAEENKENLDSTFSD